MNIRVAVAGAFAVVVSICVVYALFAPKKIQSKQDDPDMLVPHKVDPSSAPEISPRPPYPKAVIDGTEVEFGRMEVGEERSHVFTLRNEGQAPLIVKKGSSTCQCTLAELERGHLEVGKSMQVTLKWKPAVPAEHFQKSADLLTNDPENKVITLRLTGMVVPRLMTDPATDWAIPEVAEGRPTVFVGRLFSPLVEKFEIVGIECGSPLISAEATPLGKEQLNDRTLSAYEIKVSVSPDVPVGPFAFPLRIKTDIPERNAEGELGEPVVVERIVTGTRRGPIRVIGREWSEEHMAILLGAFPAAKGKTLTLTMLVRGAPEEGLRVTEGPVSSVKDLKATIQPDEKSRGHLARFQLKVEYPPGGPRTEHRESDPATIKFQTNHPDAPEVELRVYFSAY